MRNKKEIIAGIYAIKNKSTNQMYIGSALDIYKRWSEHKKSLMLGLHNKKLQTAWNLYGELEFEFIILENIKPNEIILLQKEQFYIDKFENSYNVNKKAIRTNKEGKPVYQYDSFGNFIKEFESISEAARIVNIKPSGIIQSCNKNKLSAAGFIWRYKGDVLNKNALKTSEIIDSHWVSVLQYDLDGNFLKEWRSISEAATNLKVNSDSITSACVGRHKTAGGFIWQYKENKLDFNKILIISDYRKRPVIQCSSNGEFIKEWDSATVAAKKLGLNRKYIAAICNGTNKRKIEQFLWKWKVN